MSEQTGADEEQGSRVAGGSHDPVDRPEPVGSDEDSGDGPTGDPRIDAALSTLAGLDATPVNEHAVAVERVHRVLQDRLAEGQD